MCMVSKTSFCLPRSIQVSNCYSVDYKYIYYLNNMILHFFFFQGILWCFSYPVERIWEDLISLTTVIYRKKLTWKVDVQGCKKLHATVWQKLVTVAKGKAKIEMSPFSWLYKFPLKHIYPNVVLVKTCKLEHLFSEPWANPIFFKP